MDYYDNETNAKLLRQVLKKLADLRVLYAKPDEERGRSKQSILLEVKVLQTTQRRLEKKTTASMLE